VRNNAPGALRGTVSTCNLELNLTLFPDKVTSISAVLNRDHGRFKQPTTARQYPRVLIQ
jgi:hypothetical protein